MDAYPRPSHADYTYLAKYSLKASSGGGRSSARETIGRVAAGAIAERYLWKVHGVEIVAFTSGIGSVQMPWFEVGEPMSGSSKERFDRVNQLLVQVTREQVDKSTVRCPDAEMADRMEQVSTRIAHGDMMKPNTLCA
jgi:chorismate synthase